MIFRIIKMIRAAFIVIAMQGSAMAHTGAKADIVLRNGVVFTAEQDAPLYSSVAVKDGLIVAVGGPGLVEQFDTGRVIDLKGRLLIPGFNDSHLHVQGQPQHYVDLTRLKSIDAILNALKKKAQELGRGRWITGYGWSEDELAEKRRPLRWDLDSAVPDNPVILARAGAHSAVANSVALALAGIDESTPDPDEGVIEKYPNGKLNGIIRESYNLVLKLVPEGSRQELTDSMENILQNLLALGITSLTDAWTSPQVYRERWEPIYQRSGARLPRATVQINPPLRVLGLMKTMKVFESFDGKTGDGNDHLKVGALKMFVDGGFTGPAAWTIDPYKSDPDYYGKPAVNIDDLYTLGKRAHDTGWQIGIHAIGDRAICEAVNVLVRILDESPREDHRHYLNHFTVMPPTESMDQMARYGIAISQQPNFTYTLEGRYSVHLDGDKLQHNNPVRTPMSHGIRVAFSSDDLPTGPLVGIYAAVTRKGMSGTVYGKDEAVSVKQAIRAYTATSAWLNHDEDVKGTLVSGKLADMVVLSGNLLTINPEKIMDVKVDMTIIGGQVLYVREQ